MKINRRYDFLLLNEKIELSKFVGYFYELFNSVLYILVGINVKLVICFLIFLIIGFWFCIKNVFEFVCIL